MRSYSSSKLSSTQDEEEEEVERLSSPLPRFPEGAEIGQVFNCYSEPTASGFNIRDHNYLNDQKKIPSGPYLCQLRGVDMFQTQDTPKNIGRNPKIMGGKLQDTPTFIFNFRLPWGILVFYSEIPKRFLPFLRLESKKLPPLSKMPPSDRTLCRFLLGDDEHRDSVLKIIPVIVKGPSIVKSTINSTPALIAKKLPVKYFYERPTQTSSLEYFEIDFDIAASSFAKRLLSLVRGNTKNIVFDLGFVIQGEKEDELPEQMMLAARIHGLDPVVTPDFPC